MPLLSKISLPLPRDRATPSDIKDDRFAVLDHISLETCCGMKKNFFEAKKVPSRFQIEWARVYVIVFRELSEIDNHRERLADFNLKLERRIKMFFIVPKLLLRKIKSDGKLLIKAGCEPSQFTVGTNGGESQLIMAITLLLEANPDWVIIALDISNAFNAIQRYSILEEELCKTSSFDLYGTTTSVI